MSWRKPSNDHCQRGNTLKRPDSPKIATNRGKIGERKYVEAILEQSIWRHFMWAFCVLLFFKSESLERQMRKYAFCMLAFFNKQQKGMEMSKYVVYDRFFPSFFFNFQTVALSLSLLGRWGGCSEPSKRSICWVRYVDRGHDSHDEDADGEDDGDGSWCQWQRWWWDLQSIGER